MKTDEKDNDCCKKEWRKCGRGRGGGAGGGALYGIGVIGALFYFLQHATTVSMWVIGIVKALFWPALIVYKSLELLKL